MKCWWVPKRSAKEIRDAVLGKSKAVLAAARPDAKMIDA